MMKSMVVSVTIFVIIVVAVITTTSTTTAFELPPKVMFSSSSSKKIGRTTIPPTGNCGIVATPCDNTWQSRYNQTFAFQKAGPFVQLKAYWGNDVACLGITNTTPLDFYYTTCQTNESLWSYGPTAIDTYVYYNNSNNLCITRSQYPISHQFTFGISLEPCCLNEKSESRLSPPCSRDNVLRQMWLEKPVSTDPYNRLNNQLTVDGAGQSGLICLTRVSDSC